MGREFRGYANSINDAHCIVTAHRIDTAHSIGDAHNIDSDTVIVVIPHRCFAKFDADLDPTRP